MQGLNCLLKFEPRSPKLSILKFRLNDNPIIFLFNKQSSGLWLVQSNLVTCKISRPDLKQSTIVVVNYESYTGSSPRFGWAGFVGTPVFSRNRWIWNRNPWVLVIRWSDDSYVVKWCYITNLISMVCTKLMQVGWSVVNTCKYFIMKSWNQVDAKRVESFSWYATSQKSS